MRTTSPRFAYQLAQHQLGNGLRVVAAPDHQAPIVAINLWYDVGSRHEVVGKTGFAHLFEHLMFSGSAKVASGQHIALLEAIGGTANATTSPDRTNYFETVPAGSLDLALWLEAERMESLLSGTTQAALDIQREVVKEEKRQREDNVPYGDLLTRLLSLSYPDGHPYAHPTLGAMSDLDAATLADVHEFFRTHYLPCNAVLSIVGDVTVDAAFAKADKYFGGLTSRTRAPVSEVPVLPPLTDPPTHEQPAAVPADAVYLAWRLPPLGTSECDAVELALDVLGSGQTTRLHQALVRDQQVSVSAGASSLGLMGGGLGIASARCRDTASLEEVTDALRAQVAKLLETGPQAAELQLAKAQFERQWLSLLSQVDSRADQLSGFTTWFSDPDRINRRIAEIAELTAGAVAAAAAQYLQPDAAAVLQYRRSHQEEQAA